MIRSLFGKILLSHLIVLLITTASIGILLSHLVTDYLIEAKRTELIRQGTATAAFLNTSFKNEHMLPALLDDLGNLSGLRLWVMGKNREIIAGQPPRRWRHRIMEQDPGANRHKGHMPMHGNSNFFTGDTKSWVYRARDDDDPSIVVAVPFPASPNTALFLYTPITGIAKTSDAISQLLFYAIGGAILLAGVFALFLSRSLTQPIRKISLAAQQFASGDYTSRTSAVGQDEIGHLGQTFNHMAAALEQIEKNRREFFSDITHELKTPIAAIQAVTESLLDDVVEDEATKRRYLNTTLGETKRMNHLINDLLNLAQLEAGQVQIHSQTISLREFMQAQKEKYEPLLAEKKQRFILTLPDTPDTLRVDPIRLDQILANLISNASRHAPEESEISLDVAFGESACILSVTDHGEGIPAKELPYLWERFYRVDKSRVRSKGGTGLGLSITKKLVEGMGGIITAESIPNETTVFRVALPKK